MNNRFHDKGWTLILISAVLLLTLVACSRKPEKPVMKGFNTVTVQLWEDLGIEKACNIDFYDGKFWVLTSGTLKIIDPEERSVENSIPVSAGICFVKSDNDTVYFVDRSQNQIQRYRFDGRKIGELLEVYEIPETISEVYTLSVSPSYICLTFSVPENSSNNDMDDTAYRMKKTILLEKSSQQVYPISDFVGEPVLVSTVGDDDILYFVSDGAANQNMLYRYENNTRTSLCQIDQKTSVDFLVHDPETDSIWYCCDGKLLCYSLGDALEYSCADLTEYIPDETRALPFSNILAARDCLYVIHNASEAIIMLSNKEGVSETTPPKMSNYTLKILVSDDESLILNDRVRLVEEIYNVDVEQVKFHATAGEDKIGLKLLANDSDFDLYCVISRDVDYYAKNNAMVDLSGYGAIVSNFNAMFEGIRNLCTSNGILCGIPLSLNQAQTLWNCNDNLLQALDLTLPSGKMTWTDFYDYACSAKQKAEERGIRDFYVQSGMNIQFIEYMSNYLDYINGTVTDAREEYKSFLNLYMKMMDEGLISDSFATASTSLFSAGGTFDYVANDVTVFPEPLFSESCKYTVGVTLLAVNPYSEHLEEAAEYVRMASSPEVLQRAVSAYLLKDRDSYQYFDRNGNLVVLEDKTGGHAVLEYVFANSTRQYFNQDVFNEIKEYMGKVKDRTMTADEFAEIIYNKTKMVIIE